MRLCSCYCFWCLCLCLSRRGWQPDGLSGPRKGRQCEAVLGSDGRRNEATAKEMVGASEVTGAELGSREGYLGGEKGRGGEVNKLWKAGEMRNVHNIFHGRMSSDDAHSMKDQL